MRELAVEKRFGSMTGAHHAALGRVHVKCANRIESEERKDSVMTGQKPADVGLTFSGNDTFLGY